MWRNTTELLCDWKEKRWIEVEGTTHGSSCSGAVRICELACDNAKGASVKHKCQGDEDAALEWRHNANGPLRNDDVWECFGIAVIQLKMKQLKKRLRWFVHVLRVSELFAAKRAVQVQGRRGRGMPRLRWKDTLHNDLKAADLHLDKAADWNKWQSHSSQADPD